MRFVMWMKLRCLDDVFDVDKFDRDYVGQVEDMRTV
jgi:hypothetical protein